MKVIYLGAPRPVYVLPPERDSWDVLYVRYKKNVYTVWQSQDGGFVIEGHKIATYDQYVISFTGTGFWDSTDVTEDALYRAISELEFKITKLK